MSFKLEISLHAKTIASLTAHSHRDAEKSDIESVNDLYGIEEISRELDANVPKAEAHLASVAKKLGLKLIGRPDISYGIHGGAEEPIEFWYQARAI